jgi:hypothetical protein
MRLIFVLAAVTGLAACATYDTDGYGYGHGDGYGRGERYGDYRYEGSAWSRRRGGSYDLRGPGVDLLDPWLIETVEGRQIVRSGWRAARRGRVDRRTAERANIWFRRHADADGDLCLTDAEIRSSLAQSRLHLSRFGR